MCGIGLCIKCTLPPHTIDQLRRRGPDFYQQREIDSILFYASILSHQGDQLTQQPIESNTHCLLFNGELYGDFDGLSDTAWLAARIDATESIEQILSLLLGLRGEFAFIIYDRIKEQLIFGRDRLGRRSLLLSATREHFCLVSVGGDEMIELPADGVYVCQTSSLTSSMTRYPYYAGTEVIGHNDAVLCNRAIVNNSFLIDHCPSHWRFEQAVTDESDNGDYIAEVESAFACAVTRRTRQRKGALGLLFSGGIDCSLVAYFMMTSLQTDEELHLFTVAFAKDDEAAFAKCPDRVTAESSFQILRNLFPHVKLRLHRINVYQGEMAKEREHIKNLIRPLKSVLDHSIGAALWYASQAARSCGVRVLLSGLGADELFAGYSQHRRIFDREGEVALGADLQNMIERIGERNCGRDDRVISDSGAEYRMPFLDLDFIHIVSRIPLNIRCDLSKPRGIGEKLLLRKLARKLGLGEIAGLEKRAIQFGSRIAKMTEGKKQKGDFMSSDLK